MNAWLNYGVERGFSKRIEVKLQKLSYEAFASQCFNRNNVICLELVRPCCNLQRNLKPNSDLIGLNMDQPSAYKVQ